MHHNTKKSNKLMKLREEPRIDIQLPDGGPLRNRIYKISAGSGQGCSKSRGKTKDVYYLVGDERRAVRKFIKVNTEFVENCFEDKYMPLQQLPEEIFMLMEEEYEIMKYNGEV